MSKCVVVGAIKPNFWLARLISKMQTSGVDVEFRESNDTIYGKTFKYVIVDEWQGIKMKQQKLEKQLADIKKLCELSSKYRVSVEHLSDAILETYEAKGEVTHD
jgi:hypothetical protein